MGQDYIPPKDADALTMMTTLAQVLAAAPANYGLVAADVVSITNAANEFGQALQDVDALAAAATAATQSKNDKRTALEKLVRPLVQRIHTNPAVTNQLKAAAGIPVLDTVPSVTTPSTPTGLTVKGHADGTNELSWRSAGNLPGTKYVVEAKVDTATAFSLVDVVTATTFDHMGQKPGVAVVYRVRARRSGGESGNSNEAVVYSA